MVSPSPYGRMRVTELQWSFYDHVNSLSRGYWEPASPQGIIPQVAGGAQLKQLIPPPPQSHPILLHSPRR